MIFVIMFVVAVLFFIFVIVFILIWSNVTMIFIAISKSWFTKWTRYRLVIGPLIGLSSLSLCFAKTCSLEMQNKCEDQCDNDSKYFCHVLSKYIKPYAYIVVKR